MSYLLSLEIMIICYHIFHFVLKDVHTHNAFLAR